jgi:uncharacterized protein
MQYEAQNPPPPSEPPLLVLSAWRPETPEPPPLPIQAKAAAGDAPPANPPPPAPSPDPRAARSRWGAIVSHLLLILMIPTVLLGGVLTFFLWQLVGKNDAFTEEQAREALNFQVNVGLLSVLLGLTIIGLPLVVLMWVAAVVLCVIAARHAARGEHYRYPWVLRIVTH